MSYGHPNHPLAIQQHLEVLYHPLFQSLLAVGMMMWNGYLARHTTGHAILEEPAEATSSIIPSTSGIVVRKCAISVLKSSEPNKLFWLTIRPYLDSWERSLVLPYRRSGRPWRVVSILEDQQNQLIHGCILHHQQPACFVPAVDSDSGLLLGERVCAIALLGRQRSTAKNHVAGRVRCSFRKFTTAPA